MKFNTQTKMLEFSNDENVSQFHDQLTEIMRLAMSQVGDDNTSEQEAAILTKDFFEQYSALSAALSSMRAHLPRGEIR